MQTECLLEGDLETRIEVKVRFLQAQGGSWMEAVERVVGPVDCRMSDLAASPLCEEFSFPLVQGAVELMAQRLDERLFRVTARILNETPLKFPEAVDREQILPHSCASTHTILAVEGGVSYPCLEPPEELVSSAAEACRHIGTWPILAGEPGDRGIMLSSPIISSYDYAQVAPESPGDLFDGAEIDEILTLRIMTMTDEEKREMREADDRACRILERTETLPEEHLMKLHGSCAACVQPAGEDK